MKRHIGITAFLVVICAAWFFVGFLTGARNEESVVLQGAHQGTVTISGDNALDICYSGVMFISVDGKDIRVTCSDAIKDTFGDQF